MVAQLLMIGTLQVFTFVEEVAFGYLGFGESHLFNIRLQQLFLLVEGLEGVLVWGWVHVVPHDVGLRQIDHASVSLVSKLS